MQTISGDKWTPNFIWTLSLKGRQKTVHCSEVGSAYTGVDRCDLVTTMSELSAASKGWTELKSEEFFASRGSTKRASNSLFTS